MSEQIKPTPGPWTYTSECFEEAPGAEAFVWGPDGDAVAACYGNLALEGSPTADARLISAAPDLLAALEALYGLVSDDLELNAHAAGIEALSAAKAALDRAHGRQPHQGEATDG